MSKSLNRLDSRPADRSSLRRGADASESTLAQNQSLPVADVRARFAELLNLVAYRKDRIVLTRHGKAIAALIPSADLANLEALEDEIDTKLADRAIKEAEKKGFVVWRSVKRERRNRH